MRLFPTRLFLLTALAVALIALAGCGGDDGESGEREAAPATEPAEMEERERPARAAKGTRIVLDGSEYGEILFDADRQAIYLFDKEKTSKPECYDECAEAWPPVTTDGAPVAGGGIDQAKLGTAKRDDGTTQITYNDHPLYYYAHEAPGEVRCHNVPGFGGIWLVLDAAGDAV